MKSIYFTFAAILCCSSGSQNAWAGTAKIKSKVLPNPIAVLTANLGDYKNYCRAYPTTGQGLHALVERPDRGPPCPAYPDSAFIPGRKIPRDFWGRAWRYDSDGETYTITSLGRDGREGGFGADQDIVMRSK